MTALALRLRALGHALALRLRDSWYAPMPPQRLAAIRIAIGLYALYFLVPRWSTFGRIARASPELFEPVGLARGLAAPLPPFYVEGLLIGTVVLAVLVILGVGCRVVLPLFAVGLLALLSYRNSWSMMSHAHNLLVVHALILAATPAGDAWSIDRHLRRGNTPPQTGWSYGWGVRLVCASTVVVYFLGGVAKVAGPHGWGWASGEVLRAYVGVNAIRYDVLTEDGAAPLYRVLFEQEWLFLGMGVGTLLLELGAPFALFGRRLGKLFAIAAIALHWGLYFMLGIKFRYHMTGAAFISFFDVERVEWLGRFGAAVRGRRPPSPRRAQPRRTGTVSAAPTVATPRRVAAPRPVSPRKTVRRSD